MNYQNPRLRDLLAGEYVLGTLHGRARARFRSLLANDDDLLKLVENWQQRLNPLAEALPEVAPPPRVWRAVQLAIREPRVAVMPPPRSTVWQRVDFWRPLAMAASVLAVVLGGYLAATVSTPEHNNAPEHIAVLSDKDAQPVWVVRLAPALQQVSIRLVQAPAPAPQNSFELWAIPASGAPPRSLGLMPNSGVTTLRLDPALAAAMTDAKALAVSLEPVGGSPSGAPTGAVLYQGPWLEL